MPLPPAIKEAFDQSGLTHAELAERVGVSRPTVSDWLRGETTPRGRNLAKLRRVLGLGQPTRAASGEDTPPRRPAAALEVPRYRIEKGQLVRTSGTLIFDAAGAQDAPHADLASLIVPAGWDNMILYVRPGDNMLLRRFDPPLQLRAALQEGHFVDGVYLVSFSAALQLHRLQELPDHVVAVLSDNAAYRIIELDLDAGDDLTLHARVLAVGGPP